MAHHVRTEDLGAIGRRLRFRIGFAALAAVLVACNGGSAGPPAFSTGVRAPEHLYVGESGVVFSDPGRLLQYSLPLTASSVPSLVIPTAADPSSIAVDANGNLVVAVGSGFSLGRLDVFNAPLSSSSTPVATIGIPPVGSNVWTINGPMAISPAGDLYATAYPDVVDVVRHPFGNTTRPSSPLAPPGLAGTSGVAFDRAGNLYVSAWRFHPSNPIADPNEILVYAPPYDGAAVETSNFTPASRGNFNSRMGALAVSATQLFAAQSTSAADPFPPRIDVYQLPITAASVPAFSITPRSTNPEAYMLAVDAEGSLYVASAHDSTISVYAPPFSAASTPVVTLKLGPPGSPLHAMAIGR